MSSRVGLFLVLVASFVAPLRGDEPAPPRHVVLVVWDGLRPDSINDRDTPTLARLAREGVFFARHHPVYPSSTEVNGTALVTGCYPGHSGLIGNREYRPAIDPLKTFATESLEVMRRGDEITGDHYLRVPTLPELLHAAGERTVIAGTKPVAAVLDRAARPNDAASVVLFEGNTLPIPLAQTLTTQIGQPFPKEIHFPNIEADAWTTEALTGVLWPRSPDDFPRFTVLWMSDPDYTQHQFGLDTRQSHRALASVDNNLATVLKELDARDLRASTDVLVVSDHGFSTIDRGIDLAKLLNEAGFTATREFKAPPHPGDVLVDGLGGSVFLYVVDHDANTVERLAEFLQGTDFAGVIFTRDGRQGFPLSAVHIDSPDAPDVVVSMRWNDGKTASGFPGSVISDGARRPGQGTHATLSPYDMHNTLVAAGPGFRRGWRDELPSGNVDVTPTIAHLLGLKNLPKMDGRVLTESFREAEGQPDQPLLDSDRREIIRPPNDHRPSQYLEWSSFGGVEYVEEGNFIPPRNPDASQPAVN